MTEKKPNHSPERMAHGYERMMERARTLLAQARAGTLPSVPELIQHAKDTAVDLGELTREEAEHVGDYLQRDLEDAAKYLSYTGRGLAGWLGINPDMLRAGLRDALDTMVDHTQLELDRLAREAQRASERHTGEVMGPGTLECTNCGERLHFRGSGHVPPCPRCRGTVFRRASR